VPVLGYPGGVVKFKVLGFVDSVRGGDSIATAEISPGVSGRPLPGKDGADPIRLEDGVRIIVSDKLSREKLGKTAREVTGEMYGKRVEITVETIE
jgi:hypothetical protein